MNFQRTLYLPLKYHHLYNLSTKYLNILSIFIKPKENTHLYVIDQLKISLKRVQSLFLAKVNVLRGDSSVRKIHLCSSGLSVEDGISPC